jgi:hypothetical protein
MGRRRRARLSKARATGTRRASGIVSGRRWSGRHEDLIDAGGRYAALVTRDAQLATSAERPDELPALAPAG